MVQVAAERNLCWAEGVNTGVRRQSISRANPTLAKIQLNIRRMMGSWRRTARDTVESAENELEDVRGTEPEQFADGRYYRKMMDDLRDTEELVEDADKELEQFLYQMRSGPSMGIDIDDLRKECDGEDEDEWRSTGIRQPSPSSSFP